MFNHYHQPQTRQEKNTWNTLKAVLDGTAQALDDIPVPGPKAAFGALLSVITALEVSLICLSALTVIAV